MTTGFNRAIRPLRYWLEGRLYRTTDHPDRLAALKDRFKNQAVLVVGNGPSLNRTPLDEFYGLPAIGMNKIDLLFARVRWRPNLVVCTNRHVMKQHQERFAGSEIPIYLAWQSRWFMHAKYRHCAAFFLDRADRTFSTDIARGVGISGTVTYTALQFAFFMGANPVILVGIDHSFAAAGPAHRLVTSRGDDPNHFDPNYFGAGSQWNLPDLVDSEQGYTIARQVFEAHDSRILDATVGGHLRIFPKIDIQEALKLCRG